MNMKKILKDVIYVLAIPALFSAILIYGYFFIYGCINIGRIDFGLIKYILKMKEAQDLMGLYTVFSFIYSLFSKG